MRLRYRNVLTLRCYEQLSYAEIAKLMDCSELQSRVLFFRAKHSLKKRLSKRGFGKQFFLVSLGLFGLITAPSAEAATFSVTVLAATVQVGFLASLIGAATTILGVVITSSLAALTVYTVIKMFVFIVAFLICMAIFLFFVSLAGLKAR